MTFDHSSRNSLKLGLFNPALAYFPDHLSPAAVPADGVDDVFLRLEAEKLDKSLQLSKAAVFTVGDLQETDLTFGDDVNTEQTGLCPEDEKYYQDLRVRISPLSPGVTPPSGLHPQNVIPISSHLHIVKLQAQLGPGDEPVGDDLDLGPGSVLHQSGENLFVL